MVLNTPSKLFRDNERLQIWNFSFNKTVSQIGKTTSNWLLAYEMPSEILNKDYKQNRSI